MKPLEEFYFFSKKKFPDVLFLTAEEHQKVTRK